MAENEPVNFNKEAARIKAEAADDLAQGIVMAMFQEEAVATRFAAMFGYNLELVERRLPKKRKPRLKIVPDKPV